MGNIRGWAGKTVFVDLSSRKIEVHPTEGYTLYLGGRGFASSTLMDNLSPDIDPLSTESLFIVSTGPLTGTFSPSSGRIAIGVKNAQNNGISFSNAGGHFGPELKFAGIDSLVVRGKADTLVYLLVKDGEVQIKDASHLKGKTNWETEAILKDEVSHRARILSIGPAGEHLVRTACIIVDSAHAAGWGGSGAVMGSKNLKAVVAIGSGNIQLADPEGFWEAAKRIRANFEESSMVRKMRRYGTYGYYGVGGIEGTVPQSVRNSQDEFWSYEKTLKMKEIIPKERYEKRRLACYACPTGCGHFYEIGESHLGPAIACEGVHANTVRAFSANLDIDDPEGILRAQALTSQLGLDVDGSSTAIAWAFEAFEKGILTKADTDGLELRFGDPKLLLELLKMTASRQGFGNILADGSYAASREFGPESEKCAVCVKKIGINEQAIRSHKAWALGIATSTRGSGHLCGSPNTEQRRISPEEGQKYFGIPTAGDPGAYEGKAEMVAWFENFKALVDSAGMCYFSSWWSDSKLCSPKDISILIEKATGINLSAEEALQIGERVLNIEKAFNTIHAGFDRSNDYLPERFYTIPVSDGIYKGERLHLDKWNAMLDRYYEIHGWDKETSLQTSACLDRLGLSDVKQRLSRYGKLV